jgi:hypothetical protein
MRAFDEDTAGVGGGLERRELPVRGLDDFTSSSSKAATSTLQTLDSFISRFPYCLIEPIIPYLLTVITSLWSNHCATMVLVV